MPLVRDCHSNKSIPEYCKIEYKEEITQLTKIAKAIDLKFQIFVFAEAAIIIITKDIYVKNPNPRPVRPKNSCSNGALLKNITVTI